MKIKKEFIPLILSGEKKYEFRNSNDREGLYLIDGNDYFLKFVGYSYSDYMYPEIMKLPTHCRCINCDGGYIRIDGQSREGILKNREYFKYDMMYVYEGIKCETKILLEACNERN